MGRIEVWEEKPLPEAKSAGLVTKLWPRAPAKPGASGSPSSTEAAPGTKAINRSLPRSPRDTQFLHGGNK